jgi:hypothetical protein
MIEPDRFIQQPDRFRGDTNPEMTDADSLKPVGENRIPGTGAPSQSQSH